MGVSITTTFPSILQVPSAIFQKGTQVSWGGKPERFSLEGRWRASATPRSVLPAHYSCTYLEAKEAVNAELLS
jgi:hypothetical protein